jgi:beta-lactamase regulating signal transducer with metallopeptidase domain
MIALNTLTAAADSWVAHSWRASLVSLGVLASVAAAHLVFRNVVRRSWSPHLTSRLWLLPLVPLSLPFVSSPVHVHRLPEAPQLFHHATPLPQLDGVRAASNAPLPATSMSPPDGAVLGSISDEAPVVSVASTSGMTPRFTLGAIFGLVWWSGTLALVVVLLQRVLATHRLVARARPCTDRALGRAFARYVGEQGAPRRTQLLLLDGLASPAAAGTLRPRVLLSPEHMTSLSPKELEFALRHELAHVRRCDVLLDLLVGLLQAVWFFHPSVWLAPRRAMRAREAACDEAAVARTGDGLAAASALLRVIELSRHRPALRAATAPLIPHRIEEERVMHLIHIRRPLGRGLSPAGIVGLVGAAVLSLPAAGRAQDTAPPKQGEVEDAAAGVPRAEETLLSAARWLIAQQREDGGWPASTTGRAFAGELDDVGVSAAVLLALQGAPATDALPGRVDALRRGLRFLEARQEPATGCFTSTTKNIVCVPSHALALRAWVVVNAAHEGSLR